MESICDQSMTSHGKIDQGNAKRTPLDPFPMNHAGNIDRDTCMSSRELAFEAVRGR